MIRRTCDQCGRPYEAQRASSRYCGATCRTHASQGIPARESVGVVPLPQPAGDGELVSSVRSALEGADRLESWQGQAALSIARRIEAASSDAAVAALQRELRASMAEAMRGVGAPQSAVSARRDELQARRQRRGSA